MKRTPIVSRRDPDDPRPWADLDLTDGSLEVYVREINGVAARPDTPVDRRTEERLRGRHAFDRGVDKGRPRRPIDPGRSRAAGPPTDEEAVPLADERHVLALTLDGELELVPESQQASVYYAHLGWYDPASGEWTVLEFHDPDDEESDR